LFWRFVPFEPIARTLLHSKIYRFIVVSIAETRRANCLSSETRISALIKTRVVVRLDAEQMRRKSSYASRQIICYAIDDKAKRGQGTSYEHCEVASK
jgi:hypothetical protein